MTEIEKRINLYRSTIGQIDKLIEETKDAEAINYLMKARGNIIVSLEKDVIEKAQESANIVLDIINVAASSVIEGVKEAIQTLTGEGDH